MKIAASPIIWSNDDMPELGADISVEQCLQDMHNIGYEGCEMGSKFPIASEEVHSLVDKYNLQVVSKWFSTNFTRSTQFTETVVNFKQHVNLLQKLGVKVVVVAECGDAIHIQNKSLISNKVRFTENQWLSLFEGLEIIGNIANLHDMEIVYHPHLGTGVQDLLEIDKLMANTDERNIKLLFDTGHVYVAGIDYVRLLESYISRISHVHLKDVRDNIYAQVARDDLGFLTAVKRGVFTVPGDGVMNMRKILSMLAKSHYNNWLVVEAEQDPSLASPYEYAKSGYDFVMKNWQQGV